MKKASAAACLVVSDLLISSLAAPLTRLAPISRSSLARLPGILTLFCRCLCAGKIPDQSKSRFLAPCAATAHSFHSSSSLELIYSRALIRTALATPPRLSVHPLLQQLENTLEQLAPSKEHLWLRLLLFLDFHAAALALLRALSGVDRTSKHSCPT